MQSLWMLFASFVFAIMGVCVKLASGFYATSEIVMYRGLVGVLFMSGFIRYHRGSFRTALPLQHLSRGIVGVIALSLWFYSIGKLPLTTAMTLNYMAPIWMAAILFASRWFGKQHRFDWGIALAILCSFSGVVLLLRPSFQSALWFPALLGLMSGMLSAIAYLQVRQLGQLGEPEYRVVFYFSVTGLLAGLLGTVVGGGGQAAMAHQHSWKGIALLLATGVTATVAQMAMTRAYRLGKTLVTANLQYSGIVFSSAWGILLWGELLNWSGWLGIGIILASGIAATFYNARSVKSTGAIASDPIAAEVS